MKILNGNEGYQKAFYEIAEILGIGARPDSPKNVFEQVIKPTVINLQKERDSLAAENAALVAEVVNIREQAEDVYAAGYRQGHLNTADGIAYAPGVEDEFYHNAIQVMAEVETPATDAYLNAVRAEGADAAAAKIRKAIHAFKDIHCGAVKECADIAEMVAAQFTTGNAGKDGSHDTADKVG